MITNSILFIAGVLFSPIKQEEARASDPGLAALGITAVSQA